MKYSREDIKQLYLDMYENKNFEKFFDAFDLPSQAFHEEINAFLDENPQLACVVAPRSVGKTTNVTLYKQTLKRIAYRQEKFIAVFAESEKKAANFLGTIKREIKENKLFAKFYHLSIPSGWIDTKYECQIRTGSGKDDYIIVMVFGAGTDPRGLNKFSRRPTLEILDDYEGLRVRESLIERDKINDRFWAEIYPARDPIRGKVWIIGTPVHEDALVWKFQLEDLIPSKFFAIIKDDGTPLWKEQKSLKEIEFDRRLAESQGATTLAVWYAEYMCDPSPVQMQILNPKLLKKYNYKDITKRLHSAKRYTLVDLQSGGKDGNDYDVMTTVAVTWDKSENGLIEKWYILDIRTGRWSEPRKLEILDEIVSQYNPIVGVENVGYQRTFLESIERHQRERNMYYRLEALEPRGVKKSERIMGLETPLCLGNIYVPDYEPKWLSELIHQMSVWSPTKDNTHDDILDTLAYIPQIVKKYGGGTFYQVDRQIIGNGYNNYTNTICTTYTNI